jgi:hypothetical protein
MAKSIFEILDTLETETSVPAINKIVEHSLPRHLFPNAEQFENENLLLNWARESNCLHACLQAGIQKFLIDCRATFKAVKKDETWTAEKGQEKLNKASWAIVERPKQGTGKNVDKARYNDCLKMIGNMAIAKMAPEQIKALAIPVYGEELVNSIFATLEGLNKSE